MHGTWDFSCKCTYHGVPQGVALRSATDLRRFLMCNHQSDLIVAVEHFSYCVADPVFCSEGIKL